MRYHIYGAALAASILVTACDNTTSVTLAPAAPQASGHEHTSGVEQGYWPPQPLNISNVESLPASALGGAQASVLDAARRNVLSNRDVRTAIGDDSREFSSYLGSPKDEFTAQFVFYNYATDETVEVSFMPDGSSVINPSPAASYQPPEHPAEVEDAVALASEALTSQGFDTSGLEGYALLDYPSTANVVAANQTFHPQRILYVTFGPGDGALPVYSALVNLSTSAVTESGPVK